VAGSQARDWQRAERRPLLHGCAPQVVLAVPHEVTPEQVAVVMSKAVFPVADRALAVTVVPEAQESPIALAVVVTWSRVSFPAAVTDSPVPPEAPVNVTFRI